MESYKEYTDLDGNKYQLVPQVYNKGDHACVGCAFKFGNSEACMRAKTCTPKTDWKNGSRSLVKGPHVWKLIKD